MDQKQFSEMVARLERESRESPGAYKVKVALLALLGFGVLLLVLLFACLGILLLVGLALLALVAGGKGILIIVKFGKLLILAAAPLWMLLKSSLSALFTRFPAPGGREILRTDAPALFAAIDEMRARMKGPPLHHVLISEDMNAAAVQRPLLGLFGFPRNYLILGLPLLESLSPHEALAVVAHEYGHLSGAHARFGAFIYRLRGTWRTIQTLASQWKGVGGRALRRVIEWYAPFFNAYTFVLARANEYEADAASAELVSPAVAASALKRVNVASAHYGQFFEQVFSGVRDSVAPPADVAERWARSAAVMPAQPLATRWLSESLNREKSAFDTHPALRARLEALPGQAEVVESLPPPLAEASAATVWLGAQAESIRAVHQANWRERVREQWANRHRKLQEKLTRLATLKDMPTLDADLTMERLCLQVDLEPEVDHLPALSEFNAAVPNRAPTLYFEGTLRLDRDDDGGIALIERAMDLDAGAVKPGCELAFRFLMRRRETERAERFAERWRTQHAWEVRRTAELGRLDPAHELVAAQLPEETMRKFRDNIEQSSAGIARAWLARRVLPSDESVLTYVIGVELTRWARFRSRGPEIVKRLAALEWPMHLFVCTVDGNKAIGTAIKALPGAEFYVAG